MKKCYICKEKIDGEPYYIVQKVFPKGEKRYAHQVCYENPTRRTKK